MRKRLISLVLAIGVVSGIVSIGSHGSEKACPMANLPDCCKKAQSASVSPEVSLARLCCTLNCSEPGTGGSASASLSHQPSSLPSVATVTHVLLFNQIHLAKRPPGPSPAPSNPKYIEHLALLI
jgi:hypothetical protein